MHNAVRLAAVAAVLLAAPAKAGTGDELQKVLDTVVAEHALVPGASVYVDAPRVGLPWSGTAGRTAEIGGQALHPDDPFRIASVMKIFTAAAILRLVEDKRLGLDDPVAPFLDTDQADAMHVLDGVNHGRKITIRHLLSHNSGLNSHDECEEFAAAVATGPTRSWTPREEIQMMIDCGDPLFAPGTPGGYHYSDTGFVMLGNVLAKVTGQDLAKALRELLPLKKLGLDQTWHELLEPAPAGVRPRAHQYFAVSDMTSWNPSFDSWGGGGYVSTAEDLARFIRGLFEGRVFKHRRTLELMTERRPYPPDEFTRSDGYGLGLRHYTVDGVECWGHAGFWSSAVLYCPSLDLALAMTTNQAADEHELHHTEPFIYVPAIAVVRAAAAHRPNLSARSRRTSRGTRYEFVFTAGDRPVGGATVRVLGREIATDATGRAVLHTRRRRIAAEACKTGVGCARVRLKAPARRSKMTACGTPRCSPSS